MFEKFYGLIRRMIGNGVCMFGTAHAADVRDEGIREEETWLGIG
jgi:hypothetical protein